MGAAEAWRQELQQELEPHHMEAIHDEVVSGLSRSRGPDELEAAWAEGGSMPREAAIEEAVAVLEAKA